MVRPKSPVFKGLRNSRRRPGQWSDPAIRGGFWVRRGRVGVWSVSACRGCREVRIQGGGSGFAMDWLDGAFQRRKLSPVSGGLSRFVPVVPSGRPSACLPGFIGPKNAASGPSCSTPQPSQSKPGAGQGFGIFRTHRNTSESVGSGHPLASNQPRGLHGLRTLRGVRGLLSFRPWPRSAWTVCRSRNLGTPRISWIAPYSVVSEMLRLNPETLRNTERPSASKNSEEPKQAVACISIKKSLSSSWKAPLTP